MDLILVDNNYNNIYKPLTEYDNNVGKHNVKFIAGVDRDLLFNNWVKDGEVWDLSNSILKCEVKKNFKVEEPSVMALTIGDGIIVDNNNVKLIFSGEKTKNFNEGVYYYDLTVDGIPYVGGKIFISRKITNND